MEGAPAEKTKKYDRQLRLWGEHGQEALETAKVCLINANATGTEILKNLILPGIGSFTIVDGNKVTGQDVGNNFFLTQDCIGKSRAQVATELLLELNEDVSGDFVEDSLESLLENNAVLFSGFSLVIACDVLESPLLRLAELLYDSDTPLLVCRSYGLLGYLRLVIREHTVIESHPDSSHDDLRLDRPFPGLMEYCDSLNLHSMDNKQHSHTPWLVLIYKELQNWKQQHNGEWPKNYKEKNMFKDLLRKNVRTNEEGVPLLEENFDEAVTHVNTALVKSRIPSDVDQIFNDPCCLNIDAESKPFWILARAVLEFVKNEGQGALPLRGSIPDMTADSERYIRLQNVYKQQANTDIAAVSTHIQNMLDSIGKTDEPQPKRRYRDPSTSPANKAQEHITEEDIKLFCKNAAFARVVRTRSLAEEYGTTSRSPGAGELAQRMEDGGDDDDNGAVFYILLRAVDRFYSEFNRYPGAYGSQVEADIPKLKACVLRLLQDLGISQSVRDEFIHEMCRFGASELHSVAAFMGGVAAQEVIKVISKQFVPINNTYIYNAMKQTSSTMKL